MKYKLNPYKLLSLVATIFFISYVYSVAQQFRNERNQKTAEIVKTIDIRNSKFYMKPVVANVQPAPVVENKAVAVAELPPTQEVDKAEVPAKTPEQIAQEKKEKLQRELDAKKKKEALKTEKVSRQYIQVATISDGKRAQAVVAKLGPGFRVGVITTKSGKKLYAISSSAFDNKAAQQSYEAKIKQVLGSGQQYVVRKLSK